MTKRDPRNGITLLAVAVALAIAFAKAPSPPACPAPWNGVGRLRVLAIHVNATGERRALVELQPWTDMPIALQRARALLYQPPNELRKGDLATGMLKVRPRIRFRNESPHPTWPTSHPVIATVSFASNGPLQLAHDNLAHTSIDTARDHVRATLTATLSPQASRFVRGLVLGDNSLDEDESQTLQQTGLTHAIAVSGMHVVIIVGSLMRLLRWLLAACAPIASRVHLDRWVAGLGIPSTLIYVEFAGSSASAWRAAMATCAVYGLCACNLRPHPLRTNLAAVLAATLLWPAEAITPGFVLSVAGTWALVSSPRVLGLQGGSSVWSSLLEQTRTSAATLPAALYAFGTLPVGTLLANLLAGPLASLVLLPLGCIHTLVALGAPTFDWSSAWILHACVETFWSLSAAVAEYLPAWTAPPLTPIEFVALQSAALVLLATPRGSIRAACLGATVLTIALSETELRKAPRGELRVTFVDVAQGDSALIDLPDGRLMLIDAGGAVFGGPDPGEELARLLAARRRYVVDIAVLTHPHPDHYGGLTAISRSVKVRELWDTGQASFETLKEPIDVLEGLAAGGARIKTARQLCRDHPIIAGLKVEVLWPCPSFDSGYELNDNSLVLRLVFGAHRFLFMGDAEKHTEASLVARYGSALAADVLKVGHHGSKTSSGEAFLNAVSPRFAIISSGIANRYGHPNRAVLGRLQRTSPRVLRTDQEGSVTFVSDGKTLSQRSFAHPLPIDLPTGRFLP